jgi:hypothetical protein
MSAFASDVTVTVVVIAGVYFSVGTLLMGIAILVP